MNIVTVIIAECRASHMARRLQHSGQGSAAAVWTHASMVRRRIYLNMKARAAMVQA